MRRMSPVLFLSLVAACGGDPFPVEDQCNPLGTNHCMTPWPSSVFEVADSSTATGVRLAIPPDTLPQNTEGVPVDPTMWNLADGFSPAAPMVVSFPGGVSSANLVHHDDFPASVTDASPTVIVDMVTGERAHHFAEVDVPAMADPDRQALYLRPAARLVGGRRYAVAVRKSLRGADGAALPVSEGFQSLLDGGSSPHPLLEKMRPDFGAVLAALESAGVPRDDLLVAWDFTTASDEFLFRDVRSARDQTIAALDATPSAVEVIATEPVDVGVKITGTFTAPLYLSNDGRYVEETVIVRDASGAPSLQGMYEVDFTAVVPSCATPSNLAGIMIYGHGLMGEGEQAASGSQRDVAAEACVVSIGTDMRGMSSRDFGAVARALTNASYADEVFEVLTQGLSNHFALSHAARTTMATELFVDDQGASIVDPSRVYYYGLSQGHIFGTTVIAYDPNITRGVVGVGGGNYSMMLERSTDWPTYRTIVNGAYRDTLDLVLMINLMQMRWDKTETASIAHVVLDGEPLGVQPKQILVHMALGDDEVPNISTHWQARTMGIPVLTPTVEMPWGLETMDGPITGSALVIMDGREPSDPPIPAENIPAPNTGAHYVTREQPASWRQIASFYATGTIVNECDGACVCPAQCQ